MVTNISTKMLSAGAISVALDEADLYNIDGSPPTIIASDGGNWGFHFTDLTDEEDAFMYDTYEIALLSRPPCDPPS